MSFRSPANMKADYDRKVDILTVIFSDAPVEESEEVKPGITLYYPNVVIDGACNRAYYAISDGRRYRVVGGPPPGRSDFDSAPIAARAPLLQGRCGTCRGEGAPPTRLLLEARPRADQTSIRHLSGRGRPSYKVDVGGPPSGRSVVDHGAAIGPTTPTTYEPGYNHQLIDWLAECFHELSRHHQHRVG